MIKHHQLILLETILRNSNTKLTLQIKKKTLKDIKQFR